MKMGARFSKKLMKDELKIWGDFRVSQFFSFWYAGLSFRTIETQTKGLASTKELAEPRGLSSAYKIPETRHYYCSELQLTLHTSDQLTQYTSGQVTRHKSGLPCCPNAVKLVLILLIIPHPTVPQCPQHL